MLSATDKVLIDGSPHLVPLLVGQVEHSARVLLPPVLKPMHLNLSVVLVPKHILVLPGVVPNPVLIQAVVFSDTVVKVERKNDLVQPFNLVELVPPVVGW